MRSAEKRVVERIVHRPLTMVRGRPAAIVGAVACVALLAAPRLAHACDLCAIYTTTEVREERTGLRLGVGEQYTYFATLKDNGKTVPNPANERLRSSITQLLIGYHFHPQIGMQFNMPIISRTFRRLESTGIVDGDETGIGDVSLIAIAKPFSWVDTETVAHLVVFGGLKFPTGDPEALGEELTEDAGESQHPCVPFEEPHCTRSAHLRLPIDRRARHTVGPPSGIHGHDLALGSGSVDGIVGAQVFGSWRRLYATADVQYLARTVGAFDYQYANDLLFETGPGVYALLGDNLWGSPYALGAQALFSGETKGTDTLDGQPAGDTGITALYLGPAFRFTWGVHLATEIVADLPVLQNTTQLQIVPDYRLRGGLTWRF
jgi:hypothetical protein